VSKHVPRFLAIQAYNILQDKIRAIVTRIAAINTFIIEYKRGNKFHILLKGRLQPWCKLLVYGYGLRPVTGPEICYSSLPLFKGFGPDCSITTLINTSIVTIIPASAFSF
jgi:hypothetical protein